MSVINDHQTVLEVLNIRKQFIGTLALSDVSIAFKEHEVHAIVGENGAGKSTLCKILTGLYQPTEGTIQMDGKEVHFAHPHDSKLKGIGMVYQERNLIQHMTGAENIMLGNEPCNGILLDSKGILQSAKQTMEKLGISVPLNKPVSQLGAGTQQIIEIIRAFSANPRVLILDEPTASLGESEVKSFLSFIKRLKMEKDVAIVFISHKLEEVYDIADTISVFTEGKCIVTLPAGELSREACIRAMLKSNDIRALDIDQTTVEQDDVILKVGNCIYDNREHRIQLQVVRGEVVGFYGLVGSGRTEFAEALFGTRPMQKADVTFMGKKITKFATQDMIERGLIMTPEKRADAIFPTYSLTDNIGILFFKKIAGRVFGFLNAKKTICVADEVLSGNNVKYSDRKQKIRELSGGNIQKIVIGRSMKLDRVSLMILDEPTNGLDLGAKNEVYLTARRLAEKEHVSSIFISSELNELLSVCNRICVFAHGNIVDMVERENFDREYILNAAFRGAES